MRQYGYRYLSVFLIMVSVLCFHAPFVSAAGYEPERYVIDDAGLLSSSELEDLEETSREISLEHDTIVCIVTTPDFSGDNILDWQRQYFSRYFTGTDTSSDGIMLAISMAERDWGLVGFGETQYAFSTYGRERIGELILSDLSDGEYYEAFSGYLSMADDYLIEAEDGTPFDSDHTYKEDIPVLFIIGGAFLLSLIVSLLIVLSWKRKMNTRILQDDASEYLDRESFHLTDRSDIFLYHTVTKTKRPKQETSQHSMHSDSSGTSGKF